MDQKVSGSPRAETPFKFQQRSSPKIYNILKFSSLHLISEGSYRDKNYYLALLKIAI